MAGYNEILVGRYNRALQKLLGMKGPKVLESLNPELHAMLQTFYGVENRWLEDWTRFYLGVAVSAAAGLQSAVQLRNPQGSNVIAVVEQITWSQPGFVNTTVNWGLSANATDLAVAVSSGPGLDVRSKRGGSTCVLSSGTASLGSVIEATAAGISGAFIPDANQEITLNDRTTQNTLVVSNLTQNQAITICVGWRERFLEDAER